MPSMLAQRLRESALAPSGSRMSPGARSTWNRLWTTGRRRSKSASSTELSASCAWASARLTAVKVLPSAGEGLVTTTVCSGCSVCRWFSRVRSVRNSSAGVSCELFRSSRCDSGAGWNGTTGTSCKSPGWIFRRAGAASTAARAVRWSSGYGVPAAPVGRTGALRAHIPSPSGPAQRIVYSTHRFPLPLRSLGAAEKVVIHGAAHGHGADDDRARPCQPEQPPLAAHQQRVFEQAERCSAPAGWCRRERP